MNDSSNTAGFTQLAREGIKEHSSSGEWNVKKKTHKI